VSIAEADYAEVLRDRQLAARLLAQPQSQLRVVERAIPPLNPSSPVRILWAGLSALLAAAMASAYVLVEARRASRPQPAAEQASTDVGDDEVDGHRA
jgi:uncharacterized protein involved in exopolysaccharide biosynthesis